MSSVEWVATPNYVVKKMLKMAQVGPEDIIYDLGSGDARILIKAVEEFRAKRAIGYELKEDLYHISLHEIKRRNLQDKVIVFKSNLYEADLSEASVVIVYLSNKANELLRPKLEQQLRYGTRVVSLTFKINNWQASSFAYAGPSSYIRFHRKFSSSYAEYYPIYIYIVPEAFK